MICFTTPDLTSLNIRLVRLPGVWIRNHGTISHHKTGTTCVKYLTNDLASCINWFLWCLRISTWHRLDTQYKISHWGPQCLIHQPCIIRLPKSNVSDPHSPYKGNRVDQKRLASEDVHLFFYKWHEMLLLDTCSYFVWGNWIIQFGIAALFHMG